MHKRETANIVKKTFNLDSTYNKQGKIKTGTNAELKNPPIPYNSLKSNPFYLPNQVRTFKFQSNAKARKTKPKPFIMSDPKTICDIDESFYNIIEGRPLRPFCDVKVYIKNLRDITLFRANAAYLKERIIQIDATLIDEEREYKKIDKLYDKTKSNFVNFLKEKYNTANSIQEKVEQKSQELNDVKQQLDALNFAYVKIRNEVENLISVYEILSNYGNFLNSVSPNMWRIKYTDFEENKLLFAKVFSDSLLPTDSFMNLYKSSKNLFKRPNIFFNQPQQLMQVFDFVRKQCLNYMQIGCYSSNILKSVLKTRDQIAIKLSAEIKELTDFTKFIENHVKSMEEEEMVFKNKFNRILFKDFRNLFCSFESSHLYTCVQFVHTQLLGGPEDPYDNIVTLATNIENLHTNIISKLDCFPTDIVNNVTREVFTRDIKTMKRAHKAQRSLKEYDLLKQSLISSFEPPRYNLKCKK